MELWELVARERIRDTLASYNWSGDAYRLDELARTFCEDGELVSRGQGPARGRNGIVEFLGGGIGSGGDEERRAARRASPDAPDVPHVVRHVLTNTRFVELTPDEARVESYFTVVTDIGLDHYGRYRDTLVPVGDEWLIQQRLVSTDWSAAETKMGALTAARIVADPLR